jgi:hypothetical protein
MPNLDEANEQLRGQGDRVPSQFRKAKWPLQNYIRGSISAIGFAHEAVVLLGDLGFAAIGFGVLDRSLWMTFLTGERTELRSELLQELAFPTGAFWRASTSAFHVPFSSSKRFTSHSPGEGRQYYGHYVSSKHNQEEISLRIYVHTYDIDEF